MKKLITISCILMVLIPGIASADVSIIQDYCEQVWDEGEAFILVHFTVVNFSIPTWVCALQIVAEPTPPNPSCIWLEVEGPDAWGGSMSPDGVAELIGDCIFEGDALTGFTFKVPLDFPLCCYVVQFEDAYGTIVVEQEECFACTIIPTEGQSWGALKGDYR